MRRAAKGEGSVVKAGAGFRSYVTVNGKRKYTSVYPSRALASQAKRALLAQREGGELSTGKVPTVKAWLDHWLLIRQNDSKPLRETTVAGYRYYIAHYIDPELGALKLDKLTMEHLEAFYSKLAVRGIKGTTIHQCHAILRVALKNAVWRGKVGRNVAALVQAPQRGPSNATTMSEADVAAVYQAAADDRYEARWHLALEFGLRPGEANAIEWSDVDLDAGTVRIHQQLQQIKGKGLMLIELPKTKKGDRVFVLPPYLLDLLQKRRAQQYVEMIQEGDRWEAWEWNGQPRSLVFTQQRGRAIPPRLDTTNWKRLLTAAGVSSVSRYTGRHTAFSMMITDGVDPATVSQTAGHATVAFTMSVYVHAVDERKAELAAHLERKATKRQGHKVQDTVQPDSNAEAETPTSSHL